MLRSILGRLVRFDSEHTDGLEGAWAGVDEAGCGPLAGPVVAAAVILRGARFLKPLNDSKKIIPKIREKLYPQILENAAVGVGIAEAEEIDALNIYHAARLAMKRAVLALGVTPAFLLVDGRARIDLPILQKSFVCGDAKSACIAAASIVAKVHRDSIMSELDAVYPGYGFKRHKGYGTAFHLKQLREIGPSPIHRKSFSPVANWQGQVQHEIIA